MWYEPDLCGMNQGTANLWRDVERIGAMQPVIGTSEGMIDIRKEPWEFLQPTRRIPILTHGVLTNTILTSAELDVETVQRRLSLECSPRRRWQLVALNYDHWIVQSLCLPQNIQDQLDQLDEYRRMDRGGMPQGDVITYRFLHNIDEPHFYTITHDDAVVAEFVVDLSELYGTSSDDIVVFIGRAARPLCPS